MDSRVEVVDLRAKIDEVKLTSIEINSYEPERCLMNGTVLADIDSLHKADVGVKEQRLSAAIWIGPRACALHVRDPDEAVKICDASGLQTGAEGSEVKQLTADVSPAGNRVGCGIPSLARQSGSGTQYRSAENGTEGRRSAATGSRPGRSSRDGCGRPGRGCSSMP